MHARSVVASAFVVATSGGAAEPIVFHTAQFAEDKAVSLVLISNDLSKDQDYDFDVLIGLSETDPDGAVVYVDPGKHPARVRCSAPAKILVGGVDYLVGGSPHGLERNNWKEDLWRAVCVAYVS